MGAGGLRVAKAFTLFRSKGLLGRPRWLNFSVLLEKTQVKYLMLRMNEAEVPVQLLFALEIFEADWAKK